ncbi:diguanylate cyclase [Pseudoduganella sp. LjRoot289]|uniref:ligand-binding sensor domain-containing diguanylate cyclase n=1 Tax=Pseudoduganella sp. LjRoot289 TaxID=3342314 RepID=UPI003ED126CA
MNHAMRQARALLLGAALLAAGSAAAVTAPNGSVADGGGLPPEARWSRLTEPAFRHLGPEQGLPSIIATAIAQDSQGFIWAGTQGGLARWDGYRFRNYLPDAKSSTALPSPFVSSLLADADGRLWVGTSGGLARYEAGSDSFVSYPASGQGGLISPAVLALAGDGAHGLWVGTAAGLDHVDAQGRITHERAGEASGLPPGAVGAVLRERSGALWVGASDGLYQRRFGQGGFSRVALPLRPGQAATVERLLLDQAGNLWIGTRRHGAFRLDQGETQPRQVLEQGAADNSFAQANIASLAEAAPGEIWIGTFGRGILIVHAASGATQAVRRDRTLPLSLNDDNVWALLRDHSGLLWAGGNRGLSLHAPAKAALASAFSDSSRRDGLSDSEIFSVAAAADGRVWLGLGANGVDILAPGRARVAGLRPDPAQPRTALPKDRIWSIAAAPDGSVYLGTNRGLYRSDVSARSVARVTLGTRSVAENTQTLLLDGGTLYVGGTAGGLWSLARASGQARRVGDGRLDKQRIVTLSKGAARAGAPRLWVATTTNLYAVTPGGAPAEPDQVLPLAPDDKAAAGQGLSGITSLLADRHGRLWIGTDAGDLQWMDGAGGTLHRIGAKGPQSRGIDKLLEDGEGDIWASTDGGLLRIDGRSLAVRAFSQADGDAFTSGYWADSGAVTAKGELMFGALGGLSVVHPAAVASWNYAPPLAVTELRVGGRALPAQPYLAPGAPALELPAAANHLELEFSSLDYSAPERNLYAYRLDGVDGDWQPSDPRRRLVNYANLAPGSYLLRLRGSNRNGVWTDKELTLALRVLPAWYQTWWWRAALAAAALLGVYGIVAARTAVLRRGQRELESKVKERTAQLEQASLALEQASLTDPLTGLRNRRFLMQHLDLDVLTAIRRYETGGAALPADADLVIYMIDLDHFKQVNDVHGHAAGDAVLMQLPARILGVFRESDYVVRWGGEEFLVLARGTARAGAAAVAERIRAAVADAPFALPCGTLLEKTCSIGYASFPFLPGEPRALNWAEVIEIADRALYVAKHSGRNGWVGFGAGEKLQGDGLAARFKSAASLVASGEVLVETSLDGEQVRTGLVRA